MEPVAAMVVKLRRRRTAFDCYVGTGHRYRPEPRRRSSSPVGADRRLAAVEMQDDGFGQDLTVPTIPLERELHVGPGRVAVVGSVPTYVVAVVNHGRSVEELEKSNWHVAVDP
jgi:hypothetical protein